MKKKNCSIKIERKRKDLAAVKRERRQLDGRRKRARKADARPDTIVPADYKTCLE